MATVTGLPKMALCAVTNKQNDMDLCLQELSDLSLISLSEDDGYITIHQIVCEFVNRNSYFLQWTKELVETMFFEKGMKLWNTGFKFRILYARDFLKKSLQTILKNDSIQNEPTESNCK